MISGERRKRRKEDTRSFQERDEKRNEIKKKRDGIISRER